MTLTCPPESYPGIMSVLVPARAGRTECERVDFRRSSIQVLQTWDAGARVSELVWQHGVAEQTL